ncbi:hypothetical protein ACQKPE_20225 [Pseudomonas sp. NPDC089554]|uniref:hypothetical protein n=1 Tax=Pseudomonas sp. NPDC089554 TaxID=3390653 RepID=UPI003D004E8A
MDAASRELYEKLKAAGIGSIDELQERYKSCAGSGDCERGIRSEYRQKEKEAGEILVGLYQSGKLTRDEYNLLVADYAVAMLEGIKQGQRAGEGGGYLDIYSLSGSDWSPLGGVANPYLDAIRTSEMVAEWRRQGLSEEKINALARQDGLIGSTLAPVDVPGIIRLVDDGATREDILKLSANLVLGKALGGGKATDSKGSTPKTPNTTSKAPDSEKVADVPATSPVAREGLREDLAAQAGIPRNIAGEPSSIWGKTMDDIKQSFTMDGATLTPKVKSASSGNAQVYRVEGSATGIKEIQHSPSTVGRDVQSTHRGEYYKITYSDGSKIKVVDPVEYRPTFNNGKPIYDANTSYINPQGQKVVFDISTKAWVPR